MGFFKEFKEDLAQAAKELMPGSADALAPNESDLQVNTLEHDIDVESELAKLDGLLEDVGEKNTQKPAPPEPLEKETSEAELQGYLESGALELELQKLMGAEVSELHSRESLDLKENSELNLQGLLETLSQEAEASDGSAPELSAGSEAETAEEPVSDSEPAAGLEAEAAEEPVTDSGLSIGLEAEETEEPVTDPEPAAGLEAEETEEPVTDPEPAAGLEAETAEGPVTDSGPSAGPEAEAAEEPVTDSEPAAGPEAETAEEPVTDSGLSAGPEPIQNSQETQKIIKEGIMGNTIDETQVTGEVEEMEAQNVEEMGGETEAAEAVDLVDPEEEEAVEKEISDEEAIITEGMRINGNLETTGSVEIQGGVHGNVVCNGKIVVTGFIKGNSEASEFFADTAKVEGEIKSSGTVKIGLGSVIIGNIMASSAVIAGAIKGDIDVKGPVVVDTSAVVMGNIKSRSVQINNGAVIEGFCSQCYADVDVNSLFQTDED